MQIDIEQCKSTLYARAPGGETFVTLIHDNLALHFSMAKATSVAAPKQIRAMRLRQEFDRNCFLLLKQPTVPRRSKN